MSVIATSADGQSVFLALEDGDGLPVILSADRDDLSSWSTIYDPAEGDAANVRQVAGNADRMLFYGNFGDKKITIGIPSTTIRYVPVVIVQYTISTNTILDISPGDLLSSGTPFEKTINAAFENPSSPDEIWAVVDDDQDLRRTLGVRSNIHSGGPVENVWETLDAALGLPATALAVLFGGAYFLDRGFVAGDNTITLDLLYSPNEFANVADLSGATVGAGDDISSVEVAGS